MNKRPTVKDISKIIKDRRNPKHSTKIVPDKRKEKIEKEKKKDYA